MSLVVEQSTDSHVAMAVESLLNFCRRENWSGHDPYDALNSRLLRSVGIFKSSLLRLVATQGMKRSPVNLRGLLRVPREQNPKGIAVFLAAAVQLHRVGRGSPSLVSELAARLLELRSGGQPHSCWGYNFDWQTRTYLVPRGTPNIICTTFAANALLDAYDQFGDPAWLEAAQSAGEFLLEGLNITREADTLCFSYTPLDHSRIHNASLLGAALLSRLHTHKPSEAFRSAAIAATRYAIARQRPDGSWPYGETSKQQWIDSFHTGYNLMALERIRQCLDLAECEPAIQKGYQFYLDHFFEPDGRAKYFHDRTYPIDIHSIAQALITLNGLEAYDSRSRPLAASVCAHALREMRSPEGWFYYQKKPFWTNRICYMRWSQAWMLLALSHQLEAMPPTPSAS